MSIYIWVLILAVANVIFGIYVLPVLMNNFYYHFVLDEHEKTSSAKEKLSYVI